MIPSPLTSIAIPQEGRDFLALVSFLPLKRYRLIPKFLLLSGETRQQLARCRGLVGYSMRAELLARRFWTVSVWDDEHSLMDFVHEIPHSRIMGALAPHMGKTRFAQWTVRATNVPIPWPEAKRRMP